MAGHMISRRILASRSVPLPRHLTIDVYTITNGTLLKDDLARRLVELDLNRLVISVDAATPETYAKIRPPGRFDVIVAGLLSLKTWKERLLRDQPRVERAFVGMSRTSRSSRMSCGWRIAPAPARCSSRPWANTRA
jgi:hypothetical protein